MTNRHQYRTLTIGFESEVTEQDCIVKLRANLSRSSSTLKMTRSICDNRRISVKVEGGIDRLPNLEIGPRVLRILSDMSVRIRFGYMRNARRIETLCFSLLRSSGS